MFPTHDIEWFARQVKKHRNSLQMPYAAWSFTISHNIGQMIDFVRDHRATFNWIAGGTWHTLVCAEPDRTHPVDLYATDAGRIKNVHDEINAELRKQLNWIPNFGFVFFNPSNLEQGKAFSVDLNVKNLTEDSGKFERNLVLIKEAINEAQGAIGTGPEKNLNEYQDRFLESLKDRVKRKKLERIVIVSFKPLVSVIKKIYL